MNFTGTKNTVRIVDVCGVKLYLPLKFAACPMVRNVAKKLGLSTFGAMRYMLRIYAKVIAMRRARVRFLHSLGGWLDYPYNAAYYEAVARWRGSYGALVDALVEFGFLSVHSSGDHYRVRNISLVSGL